MNITAPILDDSSYDDLRKQLVNRIPVFNPEWTDHNASDPGITVLELFAYLGEHVVHRFNQIPEATYVEFLNLLQVPRRAAEPAKALLTFSAESLPAIAVNGTTIASAGKLKFETDNVIDVWPVTAKAVVKSAAPLPSFGSDEYSQVQLAMDALDSPENAQAIGYEVLEIAREQGDEIIDAAASVDGMIWLAVLNNTSELNDVVLNAMNNGEAVLNIGFSPDQAPPDIDDILPCPGPGSEPVNGAVQWQVSTEQNIDNEQAVYQTVTPAGDTTAGLRHEGVVRLTIPKQVGSFTYVDDDIRGAGDLPPQLDAQTEDKVLFWIRGFRIDNDRFGLIRFLDVNVTDCIQKVTARPEYLGVGIAQPDQRVVLNHPPVISNSLALEVEEFDGWRPWSEVDGFHSSGSDDPHYMLDRVTGAVTFGIKKVPQIGQRIRARSYQYGGGRVGNVAVDAIDKISGVSRVKIRNPFPAYGGADDESLAASLDRIPAEIRRKDRAVTPSDFQELALATPGASIARAETLELFRPKTRETDAAGVVTVMVAPQQASDPEQPPTPTRAQLKQVCKWLDQRRLVTTEVYIIPPVYKPIAVAVGLRAKAGFSVDAVRVWVETVLRQYLSPLPPFGPYGEGWPLGRVVHSAELEAAVLQVEGVEFLQGLDVATFNQSTASWVSGKVSLELDELPWLLEVTVVEGTALTPGDAIGIPTTNGPLVPVPVISDEC